MLKFGSARHDENGKITGGKAGDQTGHEVETQDFYVHPKGWYVFRAKDVNHAKRLANKMLQACNNPAIGYDQNQRNTIMKYGIATNTPCECDCSSLVRQCVYEACGVDIGNVNTSTLPTALKKSGLFKDCMTYKSGLTLYDGDILVTKVKGHCGIIVSGNSRFIENKSKSIHDVALEVIKGKWGSGNDRKLNLTCAGYDYRAVQDEVNKILRG